MGVEFRGMGRNCVKSSYLAGVRAEGGWAGGWCTNGQIHKWPGRAGKRGQQPREEVRGALKFRQVRHRDPGIALAAISGHLRHSKDDLLDGFFQESFLLAGKLIVRAYSFARILPALC